MQVLESATAKSTFMETGIIKGLLIENTGVITVPHSHDSNRIKRLIRYNKGLEEQGNLIQLNESFLESKLEDLESISSLPGTIEKFTLARLTELALLCVGNYADNGCIGELGDLMFNPRLIHVHIKGKHVPVKKERYTALTVQFKDKGQSRGGVIEWLKSNTMLETVKEPILLHLVSLLEKNGCSEAYVKSVRERMSFAVTLTCRLSISQIPERMSIEEWISSLRENDRGLIEKLFCRFDKTIFNDLGDKIRCFYA